MDIKELNTEALECQELDQSNSTSVFSNVFSPVFGNGEENQE